VGNEVDQPIPAREVADGEGQGVREHKGAMAHLLVGLGARNGGRRRLVGDGQGAAARVNGGEGFPVRDWWRGVVG
jgi:hypothetical protein